MNIYSIYKATNLINGKIYIGYSGNFRKRLNAHKRKAFSKSKEFENIYFYNSMRKYGWENFKFEIIYQSKDKEHCHFEMETYFICYYDTYYLSNNGYNMTYGGEGAVGYKMSEEGKINIKLKRKYAKKNPKFQTYEFYNENGEYIKINNIEKFCKENNIKSSGLRSLFYNKRNFCNGWIKYIEGLSYQETLNLVRSRISNINYWKFYNEKGEIIEIYNLSKFCKENYLCKQSMIKVHDGKCCSYKGYIKFYDHLSYEEYLENIQKIKSKSRLENNHK